MTPAEQLYIILAALYASECVFKVRRDVQVLATSLGFGWRLARVHVPATGADWGLVIDGPLPVATSFVTADWPFSFGSEGVLGYVGRCFSPQGRIVQSGRFVRYGDLGEVEIDGRDLRLKGHMFVQATSERDALRCRDLMLQLRDLPAADRPAAIRQAFDETLSIAAIDARLDELRSANFVCRAAATVLFAVIFGGGAALLWTKNGYYFWPFLLALLVVGHIVAVTSLFRASGRLGLRQTEGMTKHLVTAVLSPLASTRGPAFIARHALEGFHPLACGITLLPRAMWSEQARRWLRDLQYPMAPAFDDENEAAVRTEIEFRAIVREQLTALLARFDWDAATECEPPEREEQACVAYCPRCHAQYTSAETGCSNCGGRATTAFE